MKYFNSDEWSLSLFLRLTVYQWRDGNTRLSSGVRWKTSNFIFPSSWHETALWLKPDCRDILSSEYEGKKCMDEFFQDWPERGKTIYETSLSWQKQKQTLLIFLNVNITSRFLIVGLIMRKWGWGDQTELFQHVIIQLEVVMRHYILDRQEAY